MPVTFNISQKLAIFIFLFLPASQVSAAEETAVSEQEQLPSPTIEEIIVVGEKSATALRFEIRNTEKSIYGMLNDLIEVEEFKLECGYRKRTSTYIRYYTCEPVYMAEARRKASQDALFEAGGTFGTTDYAYYDVLSNALQDDEDLKATLKDKAQEHRDMIDMLARENPELMDSIFDLQVLVEEQERRKESWWRNLLGRD